MDRAVWWRRLGALSSIMVVAQRDQESGVVVDIDSAGEAAYYEGNFEMGTKMLVRRSSP